MSEVIQHYSSTLAKAPAISVVAVTVCSDYGGRVNERVSERVI